MIEIQGRIVPMASAIRAHFVGISRFNVRSSTSFAVASRSAQGTEQIDVGDAYVYPA